MFVRFPGIVWYCDRCNDCLSEQDNFYDYCYVWECTNCGWENIISSESIYESEEEFRNSNYEFSDDGDDESLGVYDAALIWLSNGMDEDYMFGYTEDELRNAL